MARLYIRIAIPPGAGPEFPQFPTDPRFPHAAHVVREEPGADVWLVKCDGPAIRAWAASSGWTILGRDAKGSKYETLRKDHIAFARRLDVSRADLLQSKIRSDYHNEARRVARGLTTPWEDDQIVAPVRTKLVARG